MGKFESNVQLAKLEVGENLLTLEVSFAVSRSALISTLWLNIYQRGTLVLRYNSNSIKGLEAESIQHLKSINSGDEHAVKMEINQPYKTAQLGLNFLQTMGAMFSENEAEI